VFAWAYLATVIAFLALAWFVGEQEPVVAVLLYSPRGLLALALLVSVPALLVIRAPRLLWTQVVCLVLVLWPVMGFRWNSRKSLPTNPPSIRLLSYNVWLGQGGKDAIRHQLQVARPDIVIFQVTNTLTESIFDEPSFRDWHRRRDGRFSVCSRFPIAAFSVPEGLSTDNGPPFVRYTLETPLGFVDVFNVHFVSPRPAFIELRRSARRRPWKLFSPEARATVKHDFEVRARQVRGLAETARLSPHPVLIAGDTNLPGLSLLFREHLGDFRDAFEEVGRGFGYTFPTEGLGPWMRLDRALAGPQLRFLALAEGDRAGSDHLPVIVEFTRDERAVGSTR
jgi:endonuclease/exonuclease/phosphatase (EEP) superfamily protein YafD